MIIINNIECSFENVYDVLHEIVTQADTIDELYEIEIDIIAENKLEIMCIYEQIVTEHAFNLFSDEYDTDVDELQLMYDDIKTANCLYDFDDILNMIKEIENMLINDNDKNTQKSNDG